MRSFASTVTIGLVVIAAVVVSVIAVGPAVAVPAQPGVSGIEPIAMQVLENLTRLLDRVADFLTQLNRVLSELAQLFGAGRD